MKTYTRKTVFADLKKHCAFAKEHDFIEVTEWINGEGFDVTIDSTNKETFSLTNGQYKLLKKLVKKLNE